MINDLMFPNFVHLQMSFLDRIPSPRKYRNFRIQKQFKKCKFPIFRSFKQKNIPNHTLFCNSILSYRWPLTRTANRQALEEHYKNIRYVWRPLTKENLLMWTFKLEWGQRKLLEDFFGRQVEDFLHSNAERPHSEIHTMCDWQSLTAAIS